MGQGFCPTLNPQTSNLRRGRFGCGFAALGIASLISYLSSFIHKRQMPVNTDLQAGYEKP
jgi:hypothetical protein